MGGIADEHVEWAVINRLKAMLDDPPKTDFNVTQTFAMFSTILIWTKQRAWVRDQDLLNRADRAAGEVRAALQVASIFEAPWLLSRTAPQLVSADGEQYGAAEDYGINADFAGMTVEQFVKWVRDALAHGDGRTIKPIHKLSRRASGTLLAGFQIQATSRGDRERHLMLYDADMKRIGSLLADVFCQSLSGADYYFEQDAATASVKEAA